VRKLLTFLRRVLFKTPGKTYLLSPEKRTPMWNRNYNAWGHEPGWDLICPECLLHNRGRNRLVLRLSFIVENPKEATGTVDETHSFHQQAWKCPICAYYVRFNIVSTRSYLKKVMKLRDGQRQLVPDKDDWARDNPKIRKQLAALGYIAGGIEDTYTEEE